MAILEGPLFSDGARGKIRRTVSFFKRGEWYHLLGVLSFKGRDSAARLTVKASFAAGVAAWRGLSDAQRAAYEESADWPMNGYNLFMQNWLLGGAPIGAVNPSDAVTDERSYGISPAAGISADYSRGDHTHGTPGALVVLDKCRAYLSGAQTTNGQVVKILLDATSFDTNSIFDAANKRIKPKKAGYYQVSGSVGIVNCPASAWFGVELWKNGAVYCVGAMTGGQAVQGYTSGTCADLIYFNGSTDYVEIYSEHVSANWTFVSGQVYTKLSVVGPL